MISVQLAYDLKFIILICELIETLKWFFHHKITSKELNRDT